VNPPPLSVDLAFWVDAIGRMIVATAAGMTLGWERSRENRQIMGLRTLGLVGLASCIAVQAIVHSGLPNVNADAAGRVMQGILSGVGFIGAGAIVKHGITVLGTATAAGVWMTAAMGAAAAFHEWAIAIALSVLGFATLHLLRRATGDDTSIDRADVLKGKSDSESTHSR